MIQDVRRQMVDLLPRLRRFAYSLTGSLDDADDVVQAAWGGARARARAPPRLDQFVPGSRFDSWMFTIVRTVWIDRTRQVRRRAIVTDPEVMEAMRYDARIQEQTEARADLAIVRDRFAQLPEDQRVVLALIVVDGMSYQEAADALELPIGTVMSRLFRARKKLLEAIQGTAAIRLATIGKIG